MTAFIEFVSNQVILCLAAYRLDVERGGDGLGGGQVRNSNLAGSTASHPVESYDFFFFLIR